MTLIVATKAPSRQINPKKRPLRFEPGIVNMLYKNLDKMHLDKFWSDGEILLRSLKYFRTIGDLARQDDLEGLRGLRIRPQEGILMPPDELWTPENITIRSATDKSTFVFFDRGSRADFHEHLFDAYVFCVSEVRLARYGDSAYRIVDHNGFGSALYKALKKCGEPVIRGTVARVRYGEYKDAMTSQTEVQSTFRKLVPEWGLGDYFLKPSCHQGDKEWRFIFILDPSANAADAKKVFDKQLITFCQPYDDT